MEWVDKFNERCERDDLDHVGVLAIRQEAAHVLEQVYASLVEAVSVTETGGSPDLDFAMVVFQVTSRTPLDMITLEYRGIQRRLLEFGKWLRHEAIGLLPSRHRGGDKRFHSDIYSRRYHKCVSQVTMYYMQIYGHVGAMKMCDADYDPPRSEMTTVNPPMEPDAKSAQEETYSDQHRVILSYLYKLAAMRARRHEGMVMVPVITETGYNSTAYKVYCSIDDFVGKDVYHDVEPELWRLITSGRNIAEWTRRVLREYDHIEFPNLVRSRNMAFDDGVYIVSEDRFRPYTTEDRRTKMNRSYLTPEEHCHQERMYRHTEELHKLSTVDFREDVNSTNSVGAPANSASTSTFLNGTVNATNPLDSPSSSNRTPLFEEQYRIQLENMYQGETGFYGPAASVYHNCDFNWQRAARHAMDIPTPNCDKLWFAQDMDKVDKDKGTGPELIQQIYALIGRMLHEVGTFDDWQLSPFFKASGCPLTLPNVPLPKRAPHLLTRLLIVLVADAACNTRNTCATRVAQGVAGTGKSTILRLIRNFFAPEDVGVIPNNIEPVFGLSAVYQKLIIICFELRSDFGLNPALMQTIMSGEPMQIQVKFKTAIPNFEWKAPFAAAGNMNADWPDAQGAISRRWAIVGFNKTLDVGDSALMSKLNAEMPLIIQKANRAYFEMLQKAGTRQAWDRDGDGTPLVLCEYFHKQRDKLTQQIDSIMACVTQGGRLVRPGDLEEKEEDEYYMKWDDFIEEYAAYCKKFGCKQLNTSSEDSYATTLRNLKIERVLDTMRNYKNNGMKEYTWWLRGVRAMKTFLDGDDDDD